MSETPRVTYGPPGNAAPPPAGLVSFPPPPQPVSRSKRKRATSVESLLERAKGRRKRKADK